MANDPILLYSTAPDEATARLIARRLIDEGLCACVNIGAPIRSIYRWRGETQESDETPLLIKTTEGAAAQTRAALIDAHPYDEPCVLGFVASHALSSDAFCAWIESMTVA